MKYTVIRKKPCNFQACTAQRAAWDAATPDANPDYFMIGQCVVAGDSAYIKWPKHYVGVQNMRSAGGKWEKVQGAIVSHYGGISGWLEHVGAVPADFKGGPKL